MGLGSGRIGSFCTMVLLVVVVVGSIMLAPSRDGIVGDRTNRILR